ncbi:helix-turn-helix transcriptional regulator [Mammaliicoccus sciuri]|nr:helix-turn-helix transcriptional regulator [Mammaliicoccus sciuri]
MRNIYEIKYLKYSATKYRNHIGISFFVVLKGRVMVTIKEHSKEYKEGETFVVKHNEWYKLDVTDGNIVVQIHLYESIITTMIPELLSYHQHVGMQSKLVPLRDHLICLCDLYLIQENNRNLKIMKQLITILEFYRERLTDYTKECQIVNRHMNPIIDEIKDYIYEHYNERITINTFTDKYHISESYFSKLFKEQMGVNFKDYLTDIRLLNSTYDLIHTQEKVIDISEKHGFYNVSSYIYSFKLYYGVTPKKYRDMTQRKQAQIERQSFFNEVDRERDLSDEEVKYYLKKFQEDYSSMICT